MDGCCGFCSVIAGKYKPKWYWWYRSIDFNLKKFTEFNFGIFCMFLCAPLIFPEICIHLCNLSLGTLWIGWNLFDQLCWEHSQLGFCFVCLFCMHDFWELSGKSTVDAWIFYVNLFWSCLIILANIEESIFILIFW